MVLLVWSESTAATRKWLLAIVCMHVAARCSGTRWSSFLLSILRIPDKNRTTIDGLCDTDMTVKSSTDVSSSTSCIWLSSLRSVFELSTKSSESSKGSTLDSSSASQEATVQRTAEVCRVELVALAPELDALLLACKEEDGRACELLDVDHVSALWVHPDNLHRLGVERVIWQVQ
jgi:hypothetical protein